MEGFVLIDLGLNYSLDYTNGSEPWYRLIDAEKGPQRATCLVLLVFRPYIIDGWKKGTFKSHHHCATSLNHTRMEWIFCKLW